MTNENKRALLVIIIAALFSFLAGFVTLGMLQHQPPVVTKLVLE